MKSVIKIAKHVGQLGSHKLQGIKFKGNKASIPNQDNIYLHVSRDELEAYLKCPETLLSNLVEAIQKDQTLAIGTIDISGKTHEEKIRYIDRQSFVYSPGADEDNILFPELKHGDEVELTGLVTRGNKNSNTIGFEYKYHILTCIPEKGNIVAYKNALFKECIIEGKISRTADPMIFDSKRPKIIFRNLTPLVSENENAQLNLV